MPALEKVEPMNVSNTLPEKQERGEQHGFLPWKEGCPEGRQVGDIKPGRKLYSQVKF